jgi:peptidoglycan/LPS O-acetylase OafA/YrhL
MLRRHLPALDGLRGFSILWVLSLHLPGQSPPLGNAITNRGYFGVEVFFAISGFLVTRSLHQCVVRAANEPGGKLAIARDFLARRVSRIWPPYFLAVLVAFVGGAVLDPGFSTRIAAAGLRAWPFAAFVANYAIPYHQTPLSLLVLWSLCFEEQFYLLLIVAYLLGARRLSFWLLAAALTSIATRLIVALAAPEVFPSSFVMLMQLHWRFDALAWGCLAWIYHQPLIEIWERAAANRRRMLALALLFAAVCVCIPVPEQRWAQALEYLVLAPAFTAFVTAVALWPGFIFTPIFSFRPLAFVGVISYEMYLSHVTVFRVLERLHIERNRPLYYTLCIALSVAVGWLFHQLFAKPTQSRLRAWLAPPELSRARSEVSG